MSEKNQKELIFNNSIYKSIYQDLIKKLPQYNKFNNGLPNSIVSIAEEMQKPFSKYENYKSVFVAIPNMSNQFKNLNGIYNNYYNISKIPFVPPADMFVNNIKLNDILDGYGKNDIEEINNEFKNNLLWVKENIINKEKVDISNCQIKLFNKLKKFYKENPIIIGFIINILFPVFIGVMINLLSQNILNIYSKPNNKTKIIYKTYINKIEIINNKPYYYYIETKNKNGKVIKGYISKRKYNKLKSSIDDNDKNDLNKEF